MSVEQLAPVSAIEHQINVEVPPAALESNLPVAGSVSPSPEAQATDYRDQIYQEVFRAEADQIKMPPSGAPEYNEGPDLFYAAVETAAETAVADYDAQVASQLETDQRNAKVEKLKQELEAESKRLQTIADAKEAERQKDAELLASLSIAEFNTLLDEVTADTDRTFDHLTAFTWRDENGNTTVTPLSELNNEFAPAPTPAPEATPAPVAATAPVEQVTVDPRAQARANVGASFFAGASGGQQVAAANRAISEAASAAFEAPASQTPADIAEYNGTPIAGATAEGTNGHVPRNMTPEMNYVEGDAPLRPEDMDLVTVGVSSPAGSVEPTHTLSHPSPHPDNRVRADDFPYAPYAGAGAGTVAPPSFNGNFVPWSAGNEEVTVPVRMRTVPEAGFASDADPDLYAGPADMYDLVPPQLVVREAAPLENHRTTGPGPRRAPEDNAWEDVWTEDDDDWLHDAAQLPTAQIPAVEANDDDLAESAPAEATPPAPRAKLRTRVYNKLTGWMRSGPNLDRFEDEFMPGYDPRNDPNMVLVGNNYVDRSAVELPRGGMSRRAYRKAMTTEFNNADDDTKAQLAANRAAKFDDEGKVARVNTDGAPLPLNREQRDREARRRIEAELRADTRLSESVSRQARNEVPHDNSETPAEYDARVAAWYDNEMRHIYFDRTERAGVMASRPVRKFGSAALNEIVSGRYVREATAFPAGPRRYNATYPTGGDGQDLRR